jgi:hypothetical protein
MSMILLWWIVSTSRRTELPPAAGHLPGVGVLVDEVTAAVLAVELQRARLDVSGWPPELRERWARALAGFDSARCEVRRRREQRAADVSASGQFGRGECPAADIGASLVAVEVDTVTSGEAAGLLGVHVRTARRLAVSLGGRRDHRGDWRIPRASVAAEANRREERT